MRRCCRLIIFKPDIIQAEVNGEGITPSVLFVHSQDHLMTAIEAKTLIEGMIKNV